MLQDLAGIILVNTDYPNGGESMSRYISEITKTNSYFSQQLIAKLFHIADTTLAKEGADILQSQFVNEVKIKTPLKLNKESLLFDLNVGHLLFNNKPLQPYTDPEFRSEFLLNPLPSIYPVNPTINITERNIYRMEHSFRKKT